MMKHDLLEYQSLPPKPLSQIALIQRSFSSCMYLLEQIYLHYCVESKKKPFELPFAIKLPESNEGAHAEKSTFAAMVMVKHQLCHAKKKETVMLLQDPHHLKDLQSKASQVDGPATLSVVQWKVLHFQQLLKQRKQLLSQPI
nr:hypothetical protein Iba_chr14bCG13550 [Ipomoea batatas]